MLGCNCGVCLSTDPRNRRNRCSVLVELPGGNLLIDTPPELRLSLLRDGISRVNAVALTHTHADHVMGMDDIRAFNFMNKSAMPIYGEPPFLDDVRRVFRYAFVESQAGGGKPRFELIPIEPGAPLELMGAAVLPLRIVHGEVPITAYRIGRFAYVTDVSRIPEESMGELRGLDVLLIGAIREKAHSTHFNFAQALEVVDALQPRKAFFTHLTHDADHEQLSRRLPDGVLPAWDGLTLDIEL